MDASINIDELRRDFASRMRELVQAEEGPKKLEKFSFETGIALRQISQWQSPRHINWPSSGNIITLALKKDVNPCWLLLGFGDQNLSQVKQNLLERREFNAIVTLLLGAAPRTRHKFEEIAKEVLGDPDLFGKVAKVVERSRR